jgi:hypothetical protein
LRQVCQTEITPNARTRMLVQGYLMDVKSAINRGLKNGEVFFG